MSKLKINRIYIFSVQDKKARSFEFSDGINIITSHKNDGNKVGKSSLLKSIYHTLGADCHFDGTWDASNKTFIVDFNVDDEAYQVYRHDKLFKIFRKNKLIYVTNNRKELGEYYLTLFNFSVKLPNRSDELEVTPPAYFFVLNFLDQDKMNGTSFDSFSNLSQYPNYKENLLYCHFGVFNDDYYILKKKQEKLKRDQKELQKNIEMLNSLILKINDKVVQVDYSSNIDALNNELELRSKEHLAVLSKLGKIKETLVTYRNQKDELVHELDELNDSKKVISKEIKQINIHICPLCSSEISNNVKIRARKYNSLEDLILLTDQLETELKKIERFIELKKNTYNEQLMKLNKYQENLKGNKFKINNIIKQQGAIEIKDQFILELTELENKLQINKDQLKQIGKKLKRYIEIKREINADYYKLMLLDKDKFNLKELNNDLFLSITKNYGAKGSNRAIATIIWYYNLLKIKAKFNSDAIRFPVILDSPMDIELDDDKREAFWKYLLSEVCENTQLIISTLGFEKSNNDEIKFDKVIIISTPKYNLLTNADYEKFKDILIQFNNARI